MPRPTRDLHLDFETYCDLDLKKVGVHTYVNHRSFRVLAVAWRLDPDPVTHSSWFHPGHPTFFPGAVLHPDVQVHAFNAAFETAVLVRLGTPPANPISCTMQRALAYGLPGRLEGAAAALGLKHQKDMAGHRLMLKMCRPLKSGAAPAWLDADLQALAHYCEQDVNAEAELAAAIPELPPEEAELSRIDAMMNTRGELGIDINRVMEFRAVAEVAEKIDAKHCAHLTGGAVSSPGTQTARLLAWLAGEGLHIPDLTRSTVEEALAACRETDASNTVEVLEIRLRMARASTRKLQRMIEMAGPGNFSLRGQFQFCGAGRTGRWSGRGVQVQNLPRTPKGFSPTLFGMMAEACAIRGDMDIFDAITPAPVLDCVSWSLRACLKATHQSKILWAFDFSQIEARVLAWLAGQKDILAVFASGHDVYVWAAAQFGSSDRQLGKVLVLALGFGMGASKLRETAWKNYGVRLSIIQAERFKSEWRRSNSDIVRFWYEMEFAAQNALTQRGKVFAVGGSGVAFVCTAKTLQMRLPSGRVLYYHKPIIEHASGSILYWGPEVGGRWVEQRTWGGKLAENATQAAARDIMGEAMLRAFRRRGLVPCMSVHDELVYPVSQSITNTESTALTDLMLEPPPWAGGLPLAGEEKIMHRYGVPAVSRTVAKTP